MKKTFLALLALLLIAAPASADIAVVDAVNARPSGDFGTTASVALNVGTDSNRAAYACVGRRGAQDPNASNPTLGGVAGTHIVTREHTTGGTPQVSIYRWKAADISTGSLTLAVELNGNATFWIAGISFSGVDQTTSEGTAVSADGTSSPATVDATTAASGDVVIDCAWVSYSGGGGTVTAGANQTSQEEADQIASGTDGAGMSTQAGADGGVMSWTLNVPDKWVTAAVPVKASGGGGGGSTLRHRRVVTP